MKTGIKFKPCNVGTAEAHNRRDENYCKAIERKYGSTYFWDEYRHLNQTWRNPDYVDSLPDIFEAIKIEVKEKTGRAMQCKPVRHIDRKTGKEKERAGCSAIREGCPPIKPDTQIEDFKPFIDWLAGYHINVISIDLHHDEGHVDDESGELKQNHHAHIIVDWIDHATGKTVKIGKKECEDMQTVLAESLGMERGTPKQDTGIDGLSAIEYKEKMALEHTRRLRKEAEEAERKKSFAEAEAAEKQKAVADLEKQRQEKEKAIDEENGSAIREGLANIFGKGKYAEIARESKEVKAENERMTKEVKEMQAQVDRIPEMAQQEAAAIVKANNDAHAEELAKLKRNNTRQVNSLNKKYNDLSAEYDTFKDDTELSIGCINNQHAKETSELKTENQSLKDAILDILNCLGQIVKEAVEAVIENVKQRLLFYHAEHQTKIVRCFEQCGSIEGAVTLIKALARPSLTPYEQNRSGKDLDDFAKEYAEMKEDIAQGRSRGSGFRR